MVSRSVVRNAGTYNGHAIGDVLVRPGEIGCVRSIVAFLQLFYSSAGACTVSCVTGTTNCSGVCRDLTADRLNCGACGTACPTGQICSAGACTVSCPAGQVDCAGTCRELETDRLNHLIENLLNMSRLQAGAVATVVRPVAPEEIVALSLRSLSHDGHRVSVSVPGDLPLVETDGALVERALANVIDNALGHTDADTAVRVDAGLVGDRVHFRVIDRGPGLSGAERDRVFEPFQQFDDHHHGGVGLGLAVARGFIEAVGGTIVLEDTPGGGLTFDIGLPIVRPSLDEVPPVP